MIPAIAAETAISFLWKHWKAILGGVVVLGLVGALTLTRATLAGVKADLKAEQAAHKETVANYRLAQEVATVKAERQLREVETRYRRNADEAQDLHDASLADASSRADAFIAANRVRTQGAKCPSSGTASTASSSSTGIPQAVPATPEMVSVTPEDVRACGEAVVYADRAHSWAMTLNQGK